MSDKTSVLEMRGITKRFPGGTLANDAIDLDLGDREIHALLGENGAGKTTLMNILYGLVTPDEGEIRIDGMPVVIQGPADAIARGIGMVHQHFMLVPSSRSRRKTPKISRVSCGVRTAVGSSRTRIRAPR